MKECLSSRTCRALLLKVPSSAPFAHLKLEHLQAGESEGCATPSCQDLDPHQSSKKHFALSEGGEPQSEREPGPVYSLRLSHGGVLGPSNYSTGSVSASTER